MPSVQQIDEDGSHIFLKCKVIKKCWRILDLEKIRMTLMNANSRMFSCTPINIGHSCNLYSAVDSGYVSSWLFAPPY